MTMDISYQRSLEAIDEVFGYTELDWFELPIFCKVSNEVDR
ncbi:hypothetical protein BJD55_gp031 [Gordonia phage Yvonnetastic]|uniref:Uncharacterized protein n=1 Tax=Gordonia phage Yvonnetastic TaxID=1821566 RepID=A0A142K9F2_9CAUD|nr:hypothetical protein BJD55_gp031 [Gordonia phage Yvonnetastic]AMS02735.1 hypothetical protein SEA_YVONNETASTIC_191 [Gordonia phage Yvonnetastic]